MMPKQDKDLQRTLAHRRASIESWDLKSHLKHPHCNFLRRGATWCMWRNLFLDMRIDFQKASGTGAHVTLAEKFGRTGHATLFRAPSTFFNGCALWHLPATARRARPIFAAADLGPPFLPNSVRPSQVRLWPSRLWPNVCLCVCVCVFVLVCVCVLCGVGVGFKVWVWSCSVPFRRPPPPGTAPSRDRPFPGPLLPGTAPSPGPPKISLFFFSLSRRNFFITNDRKGSQSNASAQRDTQLLRESVVPHDLMRGRNGVTRPWHTAPVQQRDCEGPCC